MEQTVRDVVQRREGISEVTLDELAHKLTVHGRSMVPQSLREETIADIKAACAFDKPCLDG